MHTPVHACLPVPTVNQSLNMCHLNDKYYYLLNRKAMYILVQSYVPLTFAELLHNFLTFAESVSVHADRAGHRHGGQPELRPLQHGDGSHHRHRHQRQPSRARRQNGECALLTDGVRTRCRFAFKPVIRSDIHFSLKAEARQK